MLRFRQNARTDVRAQPATHKQFHPPLQQRFQKLCQLHEVPEGFLLREKLHEDVHVAAGLGSITPNGAE